MSELIRVPDIGSGEGEVIELFVKVGDTVEADQSILTLESDKASMEIPAPKAGVVKSLKVKLGDRLKEGDELLELEIEGATDAAPAAAPAAAAAPAGEGQDVLSPLEGKFFLVKNAQETAMKVGDVVKEGDVLCYVEAMKTYNAIRAEFGGTITAICANPGDTVSEDDVLMKIG